MLRPSNGIRLRLTPAPDEGLGGIGRVDANGPLYRSVQSKVTFLLASLYFGAGSIRSKKHNDIGLGVFKHLGLVNGIGFSNRSIINGELKAYQ